MTRLGGDRSRSVSERAETEAAAAEAGRGPMPSSPGPTPSWAPSLGHLRLLVRQPGVTRSLRVCARAFPS
jgi:hypothetical protein